MHYRKIVDVTAARSATISAEELVAADERLRQLNPNRQRGPLAIVVDRDRGELAESFKVLVADDRPVEVFQSLREARAWLARFPVLMSPA
jgi:hypothetical protein